MEAYPFQSNFTGYDDAGNPLYDRAVGASFMHAREKLYYTNGIFPNPSDNFQVMATDTMNIHIQPGTCFIEGITGIEDSSTVLTIEQAEELTTRTDTVVLRCDFVNRWVEVAVKKGTAELTRNGNVWELKLAEITVPKMALSITQANIVDTRLGSECGVVTGAVTTVDTSTLFAEYYQRQQYFLQMMADNEAAYNAWYDLFKATAETGFQERYNAWDGRIATFDSWFNKNQAAIFDAQYFDFDNPAYRAGMEYGYKKTTSGASTIIIEQWTILADGSIYATRTNEKDASGKWTVSTVCDCLGVNTKVVWDKSSGSWKGVVESCPIL